jgi:hypothetical protein
VIDFVALAAAGAASAWLKLQRDAQRDAQRERSRKPPV